MDIIYIVEDDDNIREMERYALTSSGFKVRDFAQSEPFHAALREQLPALVLLDIMLPKEDGLEILRSLRSEERTKRLPVIMVTAKAAEIDKVRGLDMGADDYLTKPFGVMELVARVKALLRRAVSAKDEGAVFRFSDIALDDERHQVLAGGSPCELTYKEYELLKALLINRGVVLSREKLLNTVWGYDFEGESRTVDMHIKTLRQKLGASGEAIKTVRNVGYKIGE